jgi:hypothetical protein
MVYRPGWNLWPASTPRTMATAEVKLLDALAGPYRLKFGPSMEFRKGNNLTINGQTASLCSHLFGYGSRDLHQPDLFDKPRDAKLFEAIDAVN